MSEGSAVQLRFRPALGLIGALIGGGLGFLLGSGWFDAITPAAVGFLLGGAAMLFGRIWLHLVVLIGVLSAVTWLLVHYSAT